MRAGTDSRPFCHLALPVKPAHPVAARTTDPDSGGVEEIEGLPRLTEEFIRRPACLSYIPFGVQPSGCSPEAPRRSLKAELQTIFSATLRQECRGNG